MTLSLKEIQSRFDRRFIQITPMGWVESHGHLIGRLFKDPCTNICYFRTQVNSSNKQVMSYRIDFLSKFRYTHQLHWYNRCVNVHGYIVEFHGFIKDM